MDTGVSLIHHLTVREPEADSPLVSGTFVPASTLNLTYPEPLQRTSSI
jgi:hypothetical protein